MIEFVSYTNKIVLYWEIPDFYANKSDFIIMHDDNVVGRTSDFHYEINNLKSDSKYTFCVYMENDEKNIYVGEVTCTTSAKKEFINICNSPYNAKGDGKTLNTKAIQRAIDDCGADKCVYIPSGDYLTGSLNLHSNMDIYLEKDAILRGTTEVKDYEPKIKSRFEGTEMMCYSALINIGTLNRECPYTCENVRIYGEGTICGGGRQLAENVIERETILMKDYLDSLGNKINECESPRTIPGRSRPRLINISCAKNILISGITIMNGASWNVHMIYSDTIITHSCIFRSLGVWNGDGWDPDSSTNCTLFDCEFYTGDDAVAIKSGKNPEGNAINIPCEHIRVFDCVNRIGHGIVIGSEMSGGINDVKIWNCNLEISARGFEIKTTKKRGGFVRNISVKNCSLSRILIHTVTYNDDGEAAKDLPVIEKCNFENIRLSGIMHEKDGRCESCEAIKVEGLNSHDDRVRNINFKNISISGTTDDLIDISHCKNVTFNN